LADAGDDGCQTLRRYPKFLGPISDFVILTPV
jgi:hypothetical protein